ncbi:substrate-binding periplasmic protein [Chitinilyticum piscinae]|uniref:Transporter substrate-binding domain-containing protein n=1 Tax=Chitinilyticum piscinae TaxID=2866724 RepID=A0A8J7FHI7_9NEIS|nr:transporter substrate-binding domain-containing protein [Chitinilyticum piscinae]MBE9608310.1 transporter substrate-binding domain-containing protein [Chitinilyticum piscinae]
MMHARLLLAVCLLPLLAHAAPTLRLVSDPWCPVACRAGSDKPGYLVELARAVFEPAGYRVDYQEVPFARAELMINRGEADGFIGVLRLPKRSSWAFPATPQAISRVCFYTRPDSRWSYRNSMSSSELPSVGSIKDYSYGQEIDAKLADSKADALSGVDGLERNLRKLAGHRIDAIVEYELVVQYQQHLNRTPLRNAGCSQQADELYLAFSPKRHDGAQLAQQLEAGIVRLRQTGQLARILQKYGLQDWAANAPARPAR